MEQSCMCTNWGDTAIYEIAGDAAAADRVMSRGRTAALSCVADVHSHRMGTAAEAMAYMTSQQATG